MDKSNISLIINCNKKDIPNIDINKFKNQYSKIYFNFNNNLDNIIDQLKTNFYSIWDFDKDYKNINNLSIQDIHKENIDISILIPIYNCEKYIKECLDSCLNQDFTGTYEIIIIDDGSTDNTIKLINKYNDSKIKLYQKEHSGISDTLNFGLTKCNGEYICRMDGDDVMYENRLTLQYKYMQRDKNVDILSNGLVCFDENLLKVKSEIPILNFDKNKITLSDIKDNCNIHHPCIFFKNNLKDFYYISAFDNFEDYELWFRLLKKDYHISSWHIPVIKYRYRNNSNSHNLNIVPYVNKLKEFIKFESKKTIGIYYIATGIYNNNFIPLIKSINNFFPQYNKKIILLSDGLEEYIDYQENNIHIEHHYIEDHPWPIVALFRFHYLVKYKVNCDYIFFINSNSMILPNKLYNWFDENKINVTKHFSYRSGIKTTYELLLPSDDNPNSTSYIGNINYIYCQSGFFGGPSNLIYDMCEDIITMIDIDLKNNIIAKWHDETYFNKWLYDKQYDKNLINITDVFFNKIFNKENDSNFIYLEYKKENDPNINKKKKLENKIKYGNYKMEHDYRLDKIINNII